MAEEVIKYTVDIDTAQLSEKLLQIRQDIDNTLSSVGGAASAVSDPLQGVAIQNASAIDNILARSESFGKSVLEQIQRDNLLLRSPAQLPADFQSKSVLENVMGGIFGLGYDPSNSLLSPGEYLRRSSYYTALRIPIIGTEFAENMQMADYFREVSRGSVGGMLNIDDAYQVASRIRNLDLDPRFYAQGFNRDEVSRIVNSMASRGDFSSTQDVDDYVKKVETAMEGVRRVVHSFKVASEEAVEIQARMRDLGIEDTGAAAIRFAARGGVYGLSARDMLIAAQTGGVIAANAGFSPELGVEGFQNLLGSVRYGRKTDVINDYHVVAMGGDMGFVQATSQQSANYFRSGMGLLALGGGEPINDFNDYLNRMAIGGAAAAATPEMGVLMAAQQARDVYRLLNNGANPNQLQIAQMLAMPEFGGFSMNVSLANMGLAENLASEKGFREAITKEFDRMSSELNRESDEIPLGGIVGRSKDLIRDVLGEWRKLKSTVSEGADNPFARWLYGRYNRSSPNFENGFDKDEFYRYLRTGVSDDEVLRYKFNATQGKFDTLQKEYQRELSKGNLADPEKFKEAQENFVEFVYSSEFMDIMGKEDGLYDVNLETGKVEFRDKEDPSILLQLLPVLGTLPKNLLDPERFYEKKELTSEIVGERYKKVGGKLPDRGLESSRRDTYYNLVQMLGIEGDTPDDKIKMFEEEFLKQKRQQIKKALGGDSVDNETLDFAQKLYMDKILTAAADATIETTEYGTAVKSRINLNEYIKEVSDNTIKNIAMTAQRKKAYETYMEGIKDLEDSDELSQWLVGGGATGQAAENFLRLIYSTGIPINIVSDERVNTKEK